MKFNIEVEVDWIKESFYDEDGDCIGAMTIDDVIQEKIVSSIVEKMKGKISEAIEKSARDKINFGIDSLLDDTLRSFMDRQIKITDRYGTVKKSYEDVEEMLAEKFDEFITQKVDGKGQPVTGCGYGDDGTRIDHLIEKKVSAYKESFDKKIVSASEAIADKIKKQITEQTNNEIQKQVAIKVFKHLDLPISK